MSSPLVSVVLPTHNRVQFVGRAIASVLGQSEQDFELIIVDDASSDGTPEFLAGLAATEPRVRILRNAQPKGGGGARNAGIAASKGKWVAFLDDDDEWLSNKLECQLAKLASDPAAVACSCSFQQHFPSGRTRVFHIPHNVTLRDTLYENVLGGASLCICSRELLLSIGGFDARLRSGQDYDLWIRLRRHGPIASCSEPLVKYQEHDGERITTHLNAQVTGARRLYFKHRSAMETAVRQRHLSFVCYVKSRQPERRLASRLRYLTLSMRYSPLRRALSYGWNSAPKLLRDCLA